MTWTVSRWPSQAYPRSAASSSGLASRSNGVQQSAAHGQAAQPEDCAERRVAVARARAAVVKSGRLQIASARSAGLGCSAT